MISGIENVKNPSVKGRNTKANIWMINSSEEVSLGSSVLEVFYNGI